RDRCAVAAVLIAACRSARPPIRWLPCVPRGNADTMGVMRLLCLTIALVLASCGDDSDCCDVKKDASIDAPVMNRVEVARVPVTVNLDVDMLFVVDDSVSTIDKQTNLKNAF